MRRDLKWIALLSVVLVVLGMVHLTAGRVLFGLGSFFGALCFSGIAVVLWRKADELEPDEPDQEVRRAAP